MAFQLFQESLQLAKEIFSFPVKEKLENKMAENLVNCTQYLTKELNPKMYIHLLCTMKEEAFNF